MDKKKLFFPAIVIILVLLILFSGCIKPEQRPVQTLNADVDWDLERIHFVGGISYPFCKQSSALFVYDTESHENWEDYNYSISASITENYRFDGWLNDDGVQHYVTYYCRGVAYCYDFWGPLRSYEEGYYAGWELTFYVDYN